MTRKERAEKMQKMQKHFTITEICEMAGISRPTFYAIIAEKSVSLLTLEKIEENLKISKRYLLMKLEKDFETKII